MRKIHFYLPSYLNYKILIISLFLFCYAISSQAQLFSSKRSKKRDKTIPTVITSDSMDFDISKNVAVFSGNVQVDDSEMKIFCHKMIINFEGNAKNTNSNKSVKDIICLKNVIIIRKLDKKEGEAGEQKALAGKAVYDVKAGKITLTINPELQRGEDSLKGDVIMYWTDSDRVSVKGRKRPSQLKIRSKPNED
jgi:lipopolysaccharide transport protein LptA